MLDLRSPEARAAAEAKRASDAAARSEREQRFAADLVEAARLCWPAPPVWLPIERCPFEALASFGCREPAILVTDGQQRAAVTVRRRFGRPVRVVRRPEMALTDHGLALVSGEYAEFDHPDWWFGWELSDALEARSGDGSGDEIGFVPTLWTLLSPIPASPAPEAA